MAEASRSRVTITLGRGGQVVKRAGPVSDADFSDHLPLTGSKRSVRDRLGNNMDASLSRGSQMNNKRQRGDGNMTRLASYGVDAKDVCIGKDDLRFKLLQKNVHRRAQSDDNERVVDLREKLSRMGQPQHASYNRHLHIPQSRETSILGRTPPTRSADDMPRMDSSRSSYSAWTLDHLRRRSPDRVVGTSRAFSPPRKVEELPRRPLDNAEELHRRPLNRAYDDVRAVSYMSKDVLDAPRSVTTSAFVTNSTLPTTSVKPAPAVPPLQSQIPSPSSVAQKSSYTVDEPQTVDGLLHSLGLGKYAILFKAEEVDMTALKQMGENDLKELGIPMGPRKKILLALLSRSKRQPQQ